MANQDTFNPGKEAATVTASPNIQAVQARYDPNASADALAAALGSDSTQHALAGFQQVYNERKLQEQSMKIEGYTQQFMDDHQGGAVSQAQLKERFPEMVPVIAARVAESIGRKQGALDVADTIQHINENDSLRLDTAARAAFVAKSRAELFAKIQPGNDFYAAGVVSAMDRAFGQEEQKWQGQTAAYHQEVQKTALSDEVVTALNSADPKASLASIDSNYANSSSLNNVERNKVIVDTAIKHAAVSDDPDVLKKVPQQYLNADSKAQLYQAELAITGQRWAKYDHAMRFEADQREKVEREGKLGILQKLATGADVNPAQYLSSPGLHAFAVAAMETPTVPESVSQSSVATFRSKLLGASNFAGLGSQAEITKSVFDLKGINPKDRATLVAEIPKLMEGTILMNDPTVKDAYTNQIGYRLDDIMRQAEPHLQSMLNQTNIRGVAMKIFESGVRGRFEATYKDTGEWPKGTAARLLVNEAVAETTSYIDKHADIKALTDMTSSPEPKKNAHGGVDPVKTPSASKAPTKSAVDLEIERRLKAK